MLALIYSSVSTKIKIVLDWLSSCILRRVVWQKFTGVSNVLAASIIKTMSSLDGGDVSKYL
jgi:hypothetical protein